MWWLSVRRQSSAPSGAVSMPLKSPAGCSPCSVKTKFRSNLYHKRLLVTALYSSSKRKTRSEHSKSSTEHSSHKRTGWYRFKMLDYHVVLATVGGILFFAPILL